MSRRTQKVASLVQQTVAQQLTQLLPSAQITVTGADVAPDLRSATVWVGIVGTSEQADTLFTQIEQIRPQIQQTVAQTMTTKFAPHLRFKLDTGGQHAEHISRLLKEL